MARGDPTFLRLDIDKILNGERISTLSGDRFKVYIVLCALSTKCRTDVLPEQMSTTKYAEGRANLGQRKGRESLVSILQHLSEEPIKLIAICPHNRRIKLLGIKEANPKLHWDRANNNCPHMGTCTGKDGFPIWGCKKGGESERLRDREISTDPDTDSGNQKGASKLAPESGAVDVKKLLEEQDRKRTAEKSAQGRINDDLEPWNQVKTESEDEREVHLWFLQLWPNGEYVWEAEKHSLLSQYRIHGRRAYAYARAILIEHRKEGKLFRYGELAYLNGIAREQAKKISSGG